MLSKQEQILFNTVKNLVKKIRHQCHLTGVEPDELIQVGCMACLEAKTPTSEIKEVAKKAILKYYYQERNLQKKKKNNIQIGKNNNKTEKNLIEEVLVASETRTSEQQEEHDNQQGLEWEDLPKKIPEDLKQDVLTYRDEGIKGFKNTNAFRNLAYAYRKKAVNYCNEIINNNSWVLVKEVDKALKRGSKHPKRPFCYYILRHANIDVNPETVELARLSFNCPLVRKQLNKADDRFEFLCTEKELTKEEKNRVYQHLYTESRTKILRENSIRINNFTKSLARSNCPLIYQILKSGLFLKRFPEFNVNIKDNYCKTQIFISSKNASIKTFLTDYDILKKDKFIEYIKSKGQKIFCPYCGKTNILQFKDKDRLFCTDCNNQFNIVSKTLLRYMNKEAMTVIAFNLQDVVDSKAYEKCNLTSYMYYNYRHRIIKLITAMLDGKNLDSEQYSLEELVIKQPKNAKEKKMAKEPSELSLIREEIKQQYPNISFTEAELYVLAKQEQKRRCTERKRQRDKEAMASALLKIAQFKQQNE